MIIEKNHIISFYNGKNKSKSRVIGIVQRADDVIMEIVHYDIEQWNKRERITLGMIPMYDLTVHATPASLEALIDDLRLDQEDLIQGCKIELRTLMNQPKKTPIKKLEKELADYESHDLNLLEQQFKQSLTTKKKATKWKHQ